MVNQTVDLIQAILADNRKVAVTIVACFALFPFVIIAFLFAAQSGTLPNIYQAEHAQLKALAIEQSRISNETLHSHKDITKELIVNRGLINESAYYLQRTCVNTSTTKEQRDDCIKPRWDRKMDEK